MRIVRKLEPLIPRLPARKRVAAYARVSSGKDASLQSLSAQISYYSDYIQRRTGWEYAGVYADEAVTGTKDSRSEFQRLLTDCRAGIIDIILTKSVSRFARNTVDLLKTVRELSALNVDVYFEREKIHSKSGEGELMLTILASFAQEESRSVSENCKWRIRKKFQEGIPNTISMFGYEMKDGTLKIIPEEAEIVRYIFNAYLRGMGKFAILKKLNELGVKTKRGNTWSENAIYNLLRNEKYAGNMMLQKTYRQDHIYKRKTQNIGKLPMYHVEGSHEPIIDKATFKKVQKELQARSEKYMHTTRKPPVYAFTGMIICGKCGKHYHRKINNVGTKYARAVWICPTFNQIGKAACDARQVPENILRTITAEVLGIPEFDEEVFKKKILSIQVPEQGRLIYLFKDQRKIENNWAY